MRNTFGFLENDQRYIYFMFIVSYTDLSFTAFLKSGVATCYALTSEEDKSKRASSGEERVVLHVIQVICCNCCTWMSIFVSPRHKNAPLLWISSVVSWFDVDTH